MKILMVVLCLSVSFVIGFMASNKYRKRKKFFNSLIMLSNKLVVDINFSQDKLSKLIESFEENYAKDLYGIKEGYLNFLKNNTELKKEELMSSKCPIAEEEKEFVFMFFKSLGRLDCLNQTKEIENFQKRFYEMKKSADDAYNKYGSLFLKLGIIFGIFLSILII